MDRKRFIWIDEELKKINKDKIEIKNNSDDEGKDRIGQKKINICAHEKLYREFEKHTIKIGR